MTGTPTLRLLNIYKTLGNALPTATVAARRHLEEAVELLLACGGIPEEAFMAVADAIANEAAKQRCRPSMLFPERPSPEAIAGELADVDLIAGLIAHLNGISVPEINAARNEKIERLESAMASGNLIFTPDGRFYRRPEAA